jgi:hypothetical protein
VNWADSAGSRFSQWTAPSLTPIRAQPLAVATTRCVESGEKASARVSAAHAASTSLGHSGSAALRTRAILIASEGAQGQQGRVRRPRQLGGARVDPAAVVPVALRGEIPDGDGTRVGKGEQPAVAGGGEPVDRSDAGKDKPVDGPGQQILVREGRQHRNIV